MNGKDSDMFVALGYQIASFVELGDEPSAVGAARDFFILWDALGQRANEAQRALVSQRMHEGLRRAALMIEELEGKGAG